MTTAIAALAARRRSRVEGEIVKVQRFKRPWVRTEVGIDDGTGTLVLRFDGRRRLPGLEPGRHLMAEGTPARDGGTLVMRNPRYEFAVGG